MFKGLSLGFMESIVDSYQHADVFKPFHYAIMNMIIQSQCVLSCHAGLGSEIF